VVGVALEGAVGVKPHRPRRSPDTGAPASAGLQASLAMSTWRSHGTTSRCRGRLGWALALSSACERRDRDIRVYTDGMKVVKVRRVGNSNVVSIPRELETRGFAPGTSVLIEELDTGELRIIPTEQVRARIRDVGQRLVGEHVEALKILAEHDPADGPAQR